MKKKLLLLTIGALVWFVPPSILYWGVHAEPLAVIYLLMGWIASITVIGYLGEE